MSEYLYRRVRLNRQSAPAASRRRRKIIWIGGQSNAQQRADVDDVTIRAGYTASYPFPLYQNVVLSVADPLVWDNDGVRDLSPRSDSATENMGVELSMGRYLDAVSSGEYAIAQLSIGGAGLNDHLRSGVAYPSGTNAFTQTVDRIKQAETELNGDIVAMVWLQGETDAADATDAAAYEANLTAFIADMRAAKASWANVPFIFNRISTHNSAPQKNTIRTAQTNVDAAVSGTTMVNCDDLTLPDNVHFSADSFVLLGERLAVAVLDALGVTVEPPKDATSLIYMPAHTLHWRWLIAQFGLAIDPPWDTLSLQEASGNVVGFWGNVVLVANGSPSYQQAVTGWATPGVGFTDGAAAQRFRASAMAPVLDLGTESCAVHANIAVTAPPAAVRDILGLGTSADVTVRITTNPFTRILAGNAVTSALGVGTAMRPYTLVVNRNNSSTRLRTNQEELSPTFSNVTGANVDLGGSTGATTPPTARCNRYHLWRGSSAEKLTAANTKAMLQALGWTVTGY